MATWLPFQGHWTADRQALRTQRERGGVSAANRTSMRPDMDARTLVSPVNRSKKSQKGIAFEDSAIHTNAESCRSIDAVKERIVQNSNLASGPGMTAGRIVTLNAAEGFSRASQTWIGFAVRGVTLPW